MLITLISWIFICFAALALGFTAANVVKSVFHYETNSFFSVFLTGIVIAAVYSEYFSLISEVGKTAVILLLIFSCTGLYSSRKYAAKTLKIWREQISRKKFFLLIAAAVIILGAVLSSEAPSNYDTENYHAPAIRWIEEFGVVKGLGNLHTRFAYNSSFLCLQALFSFSWLLNISLHSMNGLIWVVMMLYVLSGLLISGRRKILPSDCLRLVFLVLLLLKKELAWLASPHTDFLPMCLTAYLFIRRSSLSEQNETDPIPYTMAALLGLFAASVKLSAGILCLFSVKPILELLRRRDFRRLISFFTAALIILLPFLLRNIILSGYIIYPDSGLGFLTKFRFLNIDWQIPESVLRSDSAVIKLFAREWESGYVYKDITRSFFEWFPIWFEKANSVYRLLIIINTGLSVLIILFLLYRMITGKPFEEQFGLLIMGITGFLFLLFTAPSPRFGRWWFYVLPAETVFYVLSKRDRLKIPGTLSGFIGVLFPVLLTAYFAVFFIKTGINSSLLVPIDYSDEGAHSSYEEINGISFYYYWPFESELGELYWPIDGGSYHLNGYYGFPGTECRQTLERIEMRGNSLKDGFRPKAEFQHIAYDFQGRLLSPEETDALNLSDQYR